jgi:hypothetical protein
MPPIARDSIDVPRKPFLLLLLIVPKNKGRRKKSVSWCEGGIHKGLLNY